MFENPEQKKKTYHPPIKKTKIVFEKIKQIIIDSNYKIGDCLPSEQKLAESLNVSRATIRSALQDLEAMDLIETRKGAGSFVKNRINLDSIKYVSDAVTMMLSSSSFSFKEIVQARHICEEGLIKLIISRNLLKDEDFEPLVNSVMKMEKFIGQYSSDFQKADMKFHAKLGDLSGNRIMKFINNFLYELFWLKLPSNYHVFKRNIRKQEELVALHKDLIKHLKNRDMDILMELVNKHARSANEVANNYLNMIKESESL